MDQTKFLRRRQFLLGPKAAEFDGWKTIKVKDNYLLSVHPDLPVRIVEHGENKAVMSGYMIDPDQPDHSEEYILQRFVQGTGSLKDVTSKLENLCGRFVLIMKRDENLWLFHDAVALRQVEYCKDEDGVVWCASQGRIIADCLELEYDKEVQDYRDMPVYRSSMDAFWLLNDRTPFQGVRNLLPNHYLDLRQGEAFRFWPTADCFSTLSVDESVKLCAPILENSIKAAAMRFDLRMGISAGGDSRKSLAASKDVKDRIYYFTHTPSQQSMVVNDVEIPARLLPKLGLKHHNLGMQFMSEEFRKIFEDSITCARESKGHIAYTLLEHFGSESTVFNSNISEVDQCCYWIPKTRIDGEALAVISGLNHHFAISEFQKWIDGAKSACDESGMNILDLFFLEQRMGRWATAAFSEYDIVHETFNPYNNRHLHCLMLSVNDRHRRNRRLNVLIKQIKYLWPEVLSEPINPPDQIIDRVKHFIRRFIFHKTLTPWLPAYEYLWYNKMKRRFRKSGNINY